METMRPGDSRPTDQLPFDRENERVIAAVFLDREAAHDAVRQLHDEGFRDTWIGLTRSADAPNYSVYERPAAEPGETRVEADNWFMRFFGEGDESLSDVLRRRGVTVEEARAAGPLPAHRAIVTVNGANHPELAVALIRQSGGRLITSGFGATGFGTEGTLGPLDSTGRGAAPGPQARTTSLYDDGTLPPRAARGTGIESEDALGDVAVGGAPLPFDRRYGAEETTTGTLPDRSMSGADDATAYDDYGRYRAGTPLDEASRLQLREERLRVDKSQVARAEAAIGTEPQDLDVVVIREEVFIERRPAAEER